MQTSLEAALKEAAIREETERRGRHVAMATAAALSIALVLVLLGR